MKLIALELGRKYNKSMFCTQEIVVFYLKSVIIYCIWCGVRFFVHVIGPP